MAELCRRLVGYWASVPPAEAHARMRSMMVRLPVDSYTGCALIADNWPVLCTAGIGGRQVLTGFSRDRRGGTDDLTHPKLRERIPRSVHRQIARTAYLVQRQVERCSKVRCRMRAGGPLGGQIAGDGQNATPSMASLVVALAGALPRGSGVASCLRPTCYYKNVIGKRTGFGSVKINRRTSASQSTTVPTLCGENGCRARSKKVVEYTKLASLKATPFS